MKRFFLHIKTIFNKKNKIMRYVPVPRPPLSQIIKEGQNPKDLENVMKIDLQKERLAYETKIDLLKKELKETPLKRLFSINHINELICECYCELKKINQTLNLFA